MIIYKRVAVKYSKPMDYTKEQLRERYDQVPPELQDAFISVDNFDVIQEIGKGAGLHIDQVGRLSEEVGLVILGFVHPKDFRERIKEKIGISDDEANLIVYELNQKIFGQIREHINKFHTPEIANQPENSVKDNSAAFSSKMDSILNLPKEEVEVVSKNGDNKGSLETKVIDPYRETL